jgi:hypothetical protein
MTHGTFQPVPVPSSLLQFHRWGLKSRGDELFSLMPLNFPCYISWVCVTIPILTMTLSGKSIRNEITLPKK